MTNIQLINGRYTATEAELLLSKIIKVKQSFHEDRIRTHSEHEEDIKQSEKRIKELEETLRHALLVLRDAKGFVDVSASIQISAV